MEVGMRMVDVERIKTFVLAGNATFTLVSARTSTRFTYRIRCPGDKDTDDAASSTRAPAYFVALLTGSDNRRDYNYLGVIFDGRTYRHGKTKACAGADAPSAKAFDFFWRCLAQGSLPDALEFWHEGHCGRCGRLLTDPSSIEIGLGPDCAEKV